MLPTLLGLLAGGVISLHAQPGQAEADAWYVEAEKLYENREYDAARGRWERALAAYRALGLGPQAANTLQYLGVATKLLGDYAAAQAYDEQALAAYRKLGARMGEANTLVNLGILAGDLGQQTHARQYYEQALVVFRELGSRENEAVVLRNLGMLWRDQGDLDRARTYFTQALEISRRLGLRQQEASALNSLGFVADDLHEYAEAGTYFGKALQIWRDLGSTDKEAAALLNLGVVATNLGEFVVAKNHYERALQIYQRGGLRKGEARALLNLADVARRHAADYSTAASNTDEALAIFRQLNLPDEEAGALGTLGNIAMDLGDYARARLYHEHALAIKRRLGLPLDEASTLNNLGIVMWSLGDYGRARSYYEEALRIRRSTGVQADADTLNNLGLLSTDLNDLTNARRYYEQALEHRRTVGNRLGEWQVQCNLGSVLLLQGQIIEARRMFQDADCSSVHVGRTYLLEGQPAQARTAFEEGLKSAEATNRAILRIGGLIGLGISEEQLGRLPEAELHYRQAIEVMEDQREGLPARERQRFLSGKVFDFPRLEAYEGLVRVLRRLAQPDQAFYWSEHTKARGLIEAMSRAASSGDFGVSASVRAREKDLINRIAGARRRLDEAFQGGNQEPRDELEQEVKRLKQEQLTLIAEIRQQYPEYAAVQYPQPLKTQDLALKEGEVLIAYEVTEPETLVFVVRAGKIEKALEVKLSRKELSALVQRYRQVFVEIGRTGSPALLAKLDVQLGQRLYNLLLKEALVGVKESERVLVVPDEILCLLPFEALVERLSEGELQWRERGHGSYPAGVEFVGDRRVLSYWQSASSLTMLRRLRKQASGNQLLAVADPVFNLQDARLSKERTVLAKRSMEAEPLRVMGREITEAVSKSIGVDEFGRLPGTAGLVERLRGLYGGQLKALVGLDASKSAVKREPLERYGAGVIFATHGIVDERVPYLRQAALVLSNPAFTGEPPEVSDGFLTMSEVMELRMPTELAAALACETGMGAEVGGEGVMNLGRAFQYAGARSVLVSLWSVEDESTNVLAERILAGIQKGETKDDAVLAARRLLREKGYEHPFFWAAFILIGDRDTARAGESTRMLLPESARGPSRSTGQRSDSSSILSSVVERYNNERRPENSGEWRSQPSTVAATTPYQCVTAAQRIRADGDHATAIEVLKKALRMDPKIDGPHFLLADVYYRLAFFDMVDRGLCGIELVPPSRVSADQVASAHIRTESRELVAPGRPAKYSEMLRSLGLDETNQTRALFYIFAPDIPKLSPTERTQFEEMAKRAGIPRYLPIPRCQPDGRARELLTLAYQETVVGFKSTKMVAPPAVTVIDMSEYRGLQKRLQSLLSGDREAPAHSSASLPGPQAEWLRLPGFEGLEPTLRMMLDIIGATPALAEKASEYRRKSAAVLESLERDLVARPGDIPTRVFLTYLYAGVLDFESSLRIGGETCEMAPDVADAWVVVGHSLYNLLCAYMLAQGWVVLPSYSSESIVWKPDATVIGVADAAQKLIRNAHGKPALKNHELENISSPLVAAGLEQQLRELVKVRR